MVIHTKFVNKGGHTVVLRILARDLTINVAQYVEVMMIDVNLCLGENRCFNRTQHVLTKLKSLNKDVRQCIQSHNIPNL